MDQVCIKIETQNVKIQVETAEPSPLLFICIHGIFWARPVIQKATSQFKKPSLSKWGEVYNLS